MRKDSKLLRALAEAEQVSQHEAVLRRSGAVRGRWRTPPGYGMT